MTGSRDPIMKYIQGGLTTEQDIMLDNALHKYVGEHILVGQCPPEFG
ncbi:MAG: hypothetical protein KAW83_05395 [Dehalococcoidia bacterium]|nr:hypothetical protein [Dehalococcoidia bacterium]